MRWSPILLLLVACEDMSQRDDRRPAVAHRVNDRAVMTPPVSLDRSGEFHLMLVDQRGTPRCERWFNDAGVHELTADLAGAHVKLGYEVVKANAIEAVKGHSIVVTKIVRAGVSEPIACYWPLAGDTIGDTTGDLVIEGGARWFRSSVSCATAIARHQKVATLLPCKLARLASPVADEDRDAGRKRFESVLRRGGTMFLFGESDLSGCTAVTIKSRRTREGVEGAFSLRYETKLEYKPEIERGVVVYEFTWKPGAETMHIGGPEYTPDGKPDESYARLCGSTAKPGPFATGVEMPEPGTLYFTEADCRDGLARYGERARWLASKEPTTWQCGEL